MKKLLFGVLLAAFACSACDFPDTLPPVFDSNTMAVYIYDGDEEGTYTLSNAISLSSSYKWNVENSAPQYLSLSSSSGGGGVHIFRPVLTDALKALLAAPEENFSFIDGQGYLIASLHFTAPSQPQKSITVAVYYQPTTYSLMPLHITGQSTTHGSVSIKLGNPTGNKSGEWVKVEATPNSGYIFVGWVKTDSRTAPIESGESAHNFQITANTTLYAIFSPDGKTDTNPTEIATEAELAAIGTATGGLTRHYKLIADIALTSAWTPIGDSSNQFTGSFDGGGKTISGLTFNFTDGFDAVGLFGFINSAGIAVQNLGVKIAATEIGRAHV